MHLFRTLHNLPPAATGAVVAIGNFDGMHLGHRAVLQEATRRAQESGAPLAAMIFEPHPREFFSPTHAPFHIYPLRKKLSLLAAEGVNILYMPRFNTAFSGLSADSFCRLLAEALHVRHVVTGEGFVFGHKRGGDTAMLRARAEALGFGYTAVEPVEEGGAPISSSRIRLLLQEGDIQAANALLGRAYAIEGRVMHGDGRGRQLGFPTANIPLGRILPPAYGVYAVRVELPGGGEARGVANIGLRPTFGGDSTPRLEAHLFDFSGDVYGRRLRVELVRHLRAERKFDGIEALKAQIAEDVERAKKMRER